MNVHITLAHVQYRTYIILPQTILGSTVYPLTFITGKKLTIYTILLFIYPTTIAYVKACHCMQNSYMGSSTNAEYCSSILQNS